MAHGENRRQTNHKIDPIYLERWSPRSFANEPVEQVKLDRIFEAARWAPSAANWQPWHYIVAQTDEDRKRFLSFIYEGNTVWCMHAPVLVAILSKKIRNEAKDVNVTHAFDTGASWGFLALEAARQGLITHAMGGFDKDKAAIELNIPEEYSIQAIFAVGYQGEKAQLPEAYQARELASDRKPLEEMITYGRFK